MLRSKILAPQGHTTTRKKASKENLDQETPKESWLSHTKKNISVLQKLHLPFTCNKEQSVLIRKSARCTRRRQQAKKCTEKKVLKQHGFARAGQRSSVCPPFWGGNPSPRRHARKARRDICQKTKDTGGYQSPSQKRSASPNTRATRTGCVNDRTRMRCMCSLCPKQGSAVCIIFVQFLPKYVLLEQLVKVKFPTRKSRRRGLRCRPGRRCVTPGFHFPGKKIKHRFLD